MAANTVPAHLRVGAWCLFEGHKVLVERLEIVAATRRISVWVRTFPAGLPASQKALEAMKASGVSQRRGPLSPDSVEPYQPPDYEEWLAHQERFSG